MTDVKIQRAVKVEDRKLPIFEEVEQMMQRIRDRAFSVRSLIAASSTGVPWMMGSVRNENFAGPRQN